MEELTSSLKFTVAFEAILFNLDRSKYLCGTSGRLCFSNSDMFLQVQPKKVEVKPKRTNVKIQQQMPSQLYFQVQLDSPVVP